MILRRVRDSRADAEAVQGVTAAAFGGGWGERGERQTARFHRRVRHLAAADPRGCWLAEDSSGRPVGAVLASRREGLWGLSLLVVVPDAQGKGLGTALLRRALDYSKGTLRGVICGTSHPVAARAYQRAGFTLHPTMRLSGTVDAGAVTVPDGPAVEGGPGMRSLMDSVDRRLRGGAHGPDHGELLRHDRLIVADDLAGSGYCFLGDDGVIALLAATSRRIAVRLLTSALLSLPPGSTATVRHLTAEQDWAVDACLTAGLELGHDGYLALRGMRPPAPYLPSIDFL